MSKRGHQQDTAPIDLGLKNSRLAHPGKLILQVAFM